MAGYTRQSTFADGDTITAALFNNEYNQLLNAFSNTSGHKHDGTANEGPVIGLIGDAGETSPNNKVLIDTTNNHIEFYVEVSSNPVQQIYIADGAIVPVTDSDVDLGTSSLYFKDAYIDSVTTTGNVSVGGNLTVTGNATISGNLTFGDADTDSINLAAEIDSHIVPNTDDTYDLGTSTKQWRNLYIDGTAEIDTLAINGTTVTSTAAELNILDGVTSTAAELNILDGVTATAAEINTLDGITSTVAELNILDGVTASATDINLIDGITNGTVIASKAIVTDANKDISGGRNITITGELDAATLDISGNADIDGTLETDALSINGTTVTSTAAELNILDGVTATAAELNLLDGVTATTAELNILDGVTSTAAELNILDGKAFLDEDDMSSNSATGIASQQSIKAYVDTTVAATNEVVEDSTPQLGGDLDLNSNDITGTGNINITGTIQSSGNITGTLATAAQTNITSLGTLTGLTVSGDANFDSGTLFVDVSTNQVGIGTTDPSADALGSADDLVIKNAASAGLTIKSADSGNQTIALGASSDEDYGIIQGFYNSGSPFIRTSISGTEVTRVTSSGLDVTGSVTADSLTVDDITINGSTISTSGSATLDLVGNLTIDVDGTTITLADGGVNFGQFYNNASGQFNIKNPTQDKDIVFLGNDGGSGVTALTLDMSNAGAATFNAGITTGGSLTVGNDSLTMSHTGNTSTITLTQKSGTQNSVATIAANREDTSTSASRLLFSTNNGTSTLQRIRINNGGDISFYEDTGTDIKFFWDSSAEALGIGTTSIRSNYSLDVRNAGNNGVNIQAGDESSDIVLSVGSTSTADKFTITSGGDVTATGTVSTPTLASPDGTGIITLANSGEASFARGAVFNENSHDSNFRVESNNNANMLFVDAGNDTIGIGVAPLNNNLSPALQFASGGTMFGYGDAQYITGNTYFDSTWKAIATGGGSNLVIDSAGFKVYNNASASAGATITPLLHFTVGPNETVINDASYDYDFRVESNGNDHMLFVDGGNDHVNIGTSTDHGGVLNIETPGQGVNLVLACTDTDANEGPILDFTRDAGNVPSDNDIMGRIRFRNDDTGLTMTNYAEITSVVADVSNGTEDGQLQFNIMDNGSIKNFAHMTGGSGVVINEDSHDINFRVESNNNVYMLMVNGGNDTVGIGNNPYTTSADLTLLGDGLAIKNDKAGGNNNWSLIQNTATSGASNIKFTLGTGSIELGHGGEIITNTVAGYHTVFNEGGVDSDFRVESNNNSHMLFVDGGNDVVCIGGSTVESGDHLEVLSSDITTNVRIRNTNSGAAAPAIIFDKASGSPADDDEVGLLNFVGQDSNNNAEVYAQIVGIATDVTSGTEDGKLTFGTAVSGSFNTTMTIADGAATFSGVLTSKSHVVTGIDNNAFEVKTNHSGNPSALRVAGAGSINGISGSFQNFYVLNVMQDSGALNSIYAAGNIKTDGNINIGTSGKGISFGATSDAAGMTSELLDDYEEGTWSPQVYYQNTTDQANATNVVQDGKYTKIGNLVFLQFRLDFSQSSSSPASDNIGVKNLPFAGANNHYAGGGNAITSTTQTGLNFQIPQAGTTLFILNNSANIGNFGDEFGTGSNKYIRGSITYMAQ